MWEVFVTWIIDNAIALGGGAALVAIVETMFAPFRTVAKKLRKPDEVSLDEKTVEALKKPAPDTGPELNVIDFIRIRRELKADLQAELAQAADEEKDQLRARIAELENQIANPDEALEGARKRIADLEARLQREGNELGADRIAEAVEAMRREDYSKADALFEEIEERRRLDVEEAARAAFGRGEVAEAEIRWADAAEHYARAARLDPSFGTCERAGQFAWRSGDTDGAVRFADECIGLAKGEDKPRYSVAINNKAVLLSELGRFAEAEELVRQALEIDKATIGEAHPDYAVALNNLAHVVKEQGRYEEAETLNRQALEIDKATIGNWHPSYSIHLNNLALVVDVQGRYLEAEGLYREALEIDKATIGEAHPSYAIHLGNLSGSLQAQGRFSEAESSRREALGVHRSSLGENHPYIAIGLNNLAFVVKAQGRYLEAEGLYRQALEIFEALRGPDHPSTVAVHGNLDALLANSPDD